jgi:acyl-CoA synthetase (AMP-forming)/AMP-acid ligase II
MSGRDARSNSFFQAYEEDPLFFSSSTPAIVEPTGPVEGGHVAHRLVSYQELLETSVRLASSLARRGVAPGDRVLIMVPMSIALYQSMLATLKLGGVCLFVDPADGLRHLDRVAAMMRPKAYIAAPRAHALRLLCPSLWRIPVQVSTAPTLPHAESLEALVGGGDPTLPTAAVAADDAAVISFTSGSTGRPKGVRRTHTDLRTQFRILCEHEGKKMLGVNFCAFPMIPIDDCAFGRTSLLAKVEPGRMGEADPALLVDQMRAYPPALVSCPPLLLTRIVEHCLREGVKLDSVRYVYTGGGDIPIGTVRRLSQAMPAARLHMIYGSTEAEPVAMISDKEVLAETAALAARGEGRCVGRAGGEIRVAVVRPTEGPLTSLEPASGFGEIVVAGPHVNASYYENEEETRLHKFHDPVTGIRWHRMGDLGYLDAQGRLFVVGRLATRVETPVGTLHPGLVEPVFEQIDGVARAALAGIPIVVKGEPQTSAALFIETAAGGADPSAVLEAATRLVKERHLPIRTVEIVPAIPLDRRIAAKVLYDELKRAYGPRIRNRLSDPLGPRLGAYFAERLPIKETLVASAGYTAGIASVALSPWWAAPWRLVPAAVVVFLFFFHLRVFDEEKDHDVDRVVHPRRVLSRGVVTLDELSPIGRLAIIIEALLAVVLGARALALWTVALVYSLLMRVEFFAREALRRRIVLYGLTHVCVMFFLTQFVVASTASGPLRPDVGILAMLLAWLNEIARKLDPTPVETERPREESYARDLGLAPTGLLLVALEISVLALGSRLGLAQGAGTAYASVLMVATGLAVLATLSFVLRPSIRAGKAVHAASALLALAQYGLLAARPFWGVRAP